MQHRKLERERLSGRQAALAPNSLFFFAAVGSFKRRKHNNLLSKLYQ
jgi:hypothetical protein